MLKTHDDVLAALADRSEVERLITQVNKGGKGTFSYVPWNQTVRLLDKVFGTFGWSAVVTSTHNDSERGIYRTDLELTVRAATKDGMVLEVKRPGTGVGIVTGDRAEAHDTAIKASRSDAISVAAKALGDAFGLYLYDKGDPARNAPVTQAAPQQTRPTDTAAGAVQRNQWGGIGNASIKRVDMMLDKGYTELQISKMDKDTVAAVCESIIKKTQAPVAPAGTPKAKNAPDKQTVKQTPPPVDTLNLEDDAIPF